MDQFTVYISQNREYITHVEVNEQSKDVSNYFELASTHHK